MADKHKIDKKKLEILELVCKNIMKEFGKESINYLGNEKIEPMPRFSSQSVALDLALGGGWAEGRIVEIYGVESSGKSTLCLHAIAEAQKYFPDVPVAFIDVEFAFDPVYAEALGVNVAELLVSQPDNGTDALNILVKLIESGIKLIIVDSVAALMPKDEADAGIEQQTMGLQARLMSQAMRKITQAAGRNKATIIFTNQIRDKIGVTWGDKTTTPGGNALKFYASIRVKMTKLGASKEGEETVATQIRAQVVKNKTAPPFRVADLIIKFGTGIDAKAEIMNMAIKEKIIEKKGSWFSYGSEQLGQGKAEVSKLFNSDPEFYEKIRKQILDMIAEGKIKLTTSTKSEAQKNKDAKNAKTSEDEDEDDVEEVEEKKGKNEKVVVGEVVE